MPTDEWPDFTRLDRPPPTPADRARLNEAGAAALAKETTMTDPFENRPSDAPAAAAEPNTGAPTSDAPAATPVPYITIRFPDKSDPEVETNIGADPRVLVNRLNPIIEELRRDGVVAELRDQAATASRIQRPPPGLFPQHPLRGKGARIG